MLRGFGVGVDLTPFLIYPYERAQQWMSNEERPPGFKAFFTKKRWMTVDAFCHWLLHQLIPELKIKEVHFPVVLYLDGHRSHMNIRISDICTENDIVLICFPPNTTHILQPCDVALFKPLKGLWKAKVHEWTGKHPTNKVPVKNMAHLLNEVWQNLSASYGQKGFRVCGLYPWNPDAVKISRFLSKDDESYETDSCETVTKNIDGVPLSSLDECEDPPAQE
ncbi:Uncharacterized protein APZ42_013502 [Daphnia magna]|uniref:DDE-1 domain-containing protein n=1 Tax=Daphnia magna TaxID=35525 RepID=A0A162QTH7_9CRUS|nr:Uncharacterized protein APZ42_013502 [Daphnia magna]